MIQIHLFKEGIDRLSANPKTPYETDSTHGLVNSNAHFSEEDIDEYSQHLQAEYFDCISKDIHNNDGANFSGHKKHPEKINGEYKLFKSEKLFNEFIQKITSYEKWLHQQNQNLTHTYVNMM